MQMLDDGPEKQEVIDEMVAIVQRGRALGLGLLPVRRAGVPAVGVQRQAEHRDPRPWSKYYRVDPQLRARKQAEWNRPVVVADRRCSALGVLALVVGRAAQLQRAPARDRDGAAQPLRRRAGGLTPMLNYLVRRVGYGVLILIGVNLSTFFLFFTVNTPDDMARLNIGGKRVTQEQIEKWKAERGYDKPLYWNDAEAGHATSSPTRSSGSARCRCSRSTSAAPTPRAPATSATRSRSRMWVSLQLAVPLFILQVIASIGVRAAAGVLPPLAASTSGASCCAC